MALDSFFLRLCRRPNPGPIFNLAWACCCPQPWVRWHAWPATSRHRARANLRHPKSRRLRIASLKAPRLVCWPFPDLERAPRHPSDLSGSVHSLKDLPDGLSCSRDAQATARHAMIQHTLTCQSSPQNNGTTMRSPRSRPASFTIRRAAVCPRAAVITRHVLSRRSLQVIKIR